MNGKSSFRKLLDQNEFIVSVQIDPPGIENRNIPGFLDAISAFREAGVKILDINSSRRISHDSVQLAAELSRMGFITIPHITTRDSSPNGILNKVLTANAWNGINAFLIITGDPYDALQAVVQSRGVFQADSIEMIKILDSRLRDAGYTETNIAFGAAVNQNEEHIAREGIRIKAKEAAGANFFMSQPIFSETQLANLVSFYREYSSLPLIVGVWPLMYRKTIEALAHETVTGVIIPEKVRNTSLEIKDEEIALWGIEHAEQLIKSMRENSFVRGIYIVTPARNPSLILPLLEKIK